VESCPHGREVDRRLPQIAEGSEHRVYLDAASARVFKAPEAHGVTSKGQIVSSHEFITGELPAQDEVDTFLIRAGFTPIRQKYWLWQKVYPRHHLRVELGDARDENFVKTPSGIVPIDVRLWAYPFSR